MKENMMDKRGEKRKDKGRSGKNEWEGKGWQRKEK